MKSRKNKRQKPKFSVRPLTEKEVERAKKEISEQIPGCRNIDVIARMFGPRKRDEQE